MSIAAGPTGILSFSFNNSFRMNEDLSNSVFSSLIFTKRKFSFIFVQYALYNGNIKKFDDW